MEHAELIVILSALNAQLSKVAAEINGKLDELADALYEADNLPVEVNALIGEIQAKVDTLDGIVPDTVEPEPEPEPEPPVEE